MRIFIAVVLAAVLWMGIAPVAHAQESSEVLTRCSESPAFQARAANFRDTTADPLSGEKRAERYGQALCGPEGLPHLIVDGRLSHAGDFLVPSVLFLYIAGWIGWVGRAYLIAVRQEKNPEQKEILIDVPLALRIMLGGFAWPAAALKEFLSGELTAADSDIPISPR